MKGKALIICAPSGTGKTTIIDYLRTQIPNLYYSVSATSRPPRGMEQDGVNYHFLSEQQFRQHILNNDFIEYEEVYPGQLYGTLKQKTDEQLLAGNNIVFDVDIHGALNIKNYIGDNALSIFILPPSIEALRQRLEHRNTETPEKINTRLQRAEYEISRASEFDRQLVNDDLETALAEALQIVTDFLNN